MTPKDQMTMILNTVNDPMCYPPLDSSKDCFAENHNQSFANRLAEFIDFMTTDHRDDAEDPDQALDMIY